MYFNFKSNLKNELGVNFFIRHFYLFIFESNNTILIALIISIKLNIKDRKTPLLIPSTTVDFFLFFLKLVLGTNYIWWILLFIFFHLNSGFGPGLPSKKNIFWIFFKVFSEFSTLVLNEKIYLKYDILTYFAYRIAFLLKKFFSLMFSKVMEQ